MNLKDGYLKQRSNGSQGVIQDISISNGKLTYTRSNETETETECTIDLASTATALATSINLWGNSFNGASDINDGLTFAATAKDKTKDLLYAQMATNDYFRLQVGGSENAGYVEIATADEATEPIYVRQYSGTFATLTRTLTLLDSSGNTTIPGDLTATKLIKSGGSNKDILLGDGSTTSLSALATNDSVGEYLPLTGGKLNSNGKAADGTSSISLELWRNKNSSWKILNDASFHIQNNYETRVKNDYFNVLTLAYNTGNATLKGSLTTNGLIDTAHSNTDVLLGQGEVISKTTFDEVYVGETDPNDGHTQIWINPYESLNLNPADLEWLYTYGVQWQQNSSNVDLERIGNMALHYSLPIQSQMKGCICQGDKIMYFLDPNDWSKKADGTPSRLDGYDGTVRVSTPAFWGKSVDGVLVKVGNETLTYNKVILSTVYIDDTYTYVPPLLIDAYKGTLLNTKVNDMGYLSTLPVNSLISVVNTNTYCRGGGNRTANDQFLTTNPCKSDLGKSRTNITTINFIAYAKNANSNILCYEYYKWILYWFPTIEYATFYNQKAVVGDTVGDIKWSKPQNGLMTGGLEGLTNQNNSYWSSFNNQYSLAPMGCTNALGNFSGNVKITIKDWGTENNTDTPYVNRYRGIESIFGDLYTYSSGIVIRRDGTDNKVYTAKNGELDYVTGSLSVAISDDYLKSTNIISTSEGWIKEFAVGTDGDFIPKTVGGALNNYKTDYYWSSELQYNFCLWLGGGSSSGQTSGLSAFRSSNVVGFFWQLLGARSYNKITY